MKKPLIIFVLLCILGWGCFSSDSSSIASGEFDPQNEDQVVEVYVRTNFYKDFKVFEKYKLEGKRALAYTDAIVYQTNDTVRWQKFLAKAETYREKIKGEYPNGQTPSSQKTESLPNDAKDSSN